MAGNTTTANLMQTAVNAAATLTAAFVNAGIAGDRSEAEGVFAGFRDSIFETLTAQPNEAPKGSSGGGSKGGSGGSSITPEEARGTELKHGKFAGETLGKVLGLSATEAAEYGYGEGDKSGRDYVKWLTTNDKNPFIQRRAKLLLPDEG